jgi:serine/threonine protein phosphatase 1
VELKRAIPAEHKSFLTSLPWVVESPGHLFLHYGLSAELGASPLEQFAVLHRKDWNRSTLNPVDGTNTDLLWQDDYSVWIGADKILSKTPLPFSGKVQVTGHVLVSEPNLNPIRIHLDTSGGSGYLTACLLRSADTEPEFISSKP